MATSTRSFGSGKRERHDASAFYARSLATPEWSTDTTLNDVPARVANRIFEHSSERMAELPDNSVACRTASYAAGQSRIRSRWETSDAHGADATRLSIYTAAESYILGSVAKHLVDIDEEALAAAQAELGTANMKETVNEALRRASVGRSRRVGKALDRLGQRRLPPREDAWR